MINETYYTKGGDAMTVMADNFIEEMTDATAWELAPPTLT